MRITDIPRQKLNAYANYRATESLEILTSIEYNSSRWSSNTVELANFTTLNLSGNYRIRKDVTVARNRYIKAVAEYNVLARSFPNNLTAMMFGYTVKPSFTVQNEAEISRPPAVNFDKPASK